MKRSHFFRVILLLLPFAIAYNPFKVTSPSVLAIEEQVNLSRFNHELDPTALLESRPRKSEIYTKAMIELKRLESEQTCHRLAAQLLMNNCRDVKEMSDQDNQLSNTQNHHVESFANGLTLCDLSRGKFVVSDACAPFTASALLRVYQGGRGKLDVPPQRTTACIEALAKDHSQWLTWVKHRDNALMFCRAVRLDIDKDETINLHKELTRLMAEFAEGLELDLEHAKHAMAEHAREMDAYFEQYLSQAEQLKAKMQGAMETFSNEVQGVSYSIKNAKGSTMDLQRMVEVLLDTVMKSNAEVAARQEQALAATTDLANSQMTDLNAMAEDTIATLHSLSTIVRDQLLPAVISINERQGSIEQKSAKLHSALIQMTGLVNNHTDSLEQARFTTESIIQTLQKTTALAQSWTEMLSSSGKAGDYALRIIIPPLCLVLGSYGLPPSITVNIGLILGGLSLAEVVVWMRHFEWGWPEAIDDSNAPSSATQLVRQKFGSMVTTPVEIEDVESEEIEFELV